MQKQCNINPVLSVSLQKGLIWWHTGLGTDSSGSAVASAR